MVTLFHALLICVGLFVLMAGVFTRPELVLEPGLAQIGAMLMILTASIGVVFSLQAQFTERPGPDVLARLALAAAAMVALFHPDRQVAWLACAVILLFVGYWWLRCRAPAADATAAAPAARADL
jgi:TRAP-type uncharacterized transport system fused permease subunit